MDGSQSSKIENDARDVVGVCGETGQLKLVVEEALPSVLVKKDKQVRQCLCELVLKVIRVGFLLGVRTVCLAAVLEKGVFEESQACLVETLSVHRIVDHFKTN